MTFRVGQRHHTKPSPLTEAKYSRQRFKVLKSNISELRRSYNEL